MAYSFNVKKIKTDLHLCYSLEVVFHPHLEAQSPESAEYKHPHVGHLNIWREEADNIISSCNIETLSCFMI